MNETTELTLVNDIDVTCQVAYTDCSSRPSVRVGRMVGC